MQLSNQWRPNTEASSTEVVNSVILAPQQDPQPKDFELKGVSENLDYVDIKKKLANSGIQVVDVNIKEDMCTQEKKGDADIKVRLNGKDDYKLKQKLSELGIEANKKEQIKKKPT
jgi:hypothetical protein